MRSLGPFSTYSTFIVSVQSCSLPGQAWSCCGSTTPNCFSGFSLRSSMDRLSLCCSTGPVKIESLWYSCKTACDLFLMYCGIQNAYMSIWDFFFEQRCFHRKSNNHSELLSSKSSENQQPLKSSNRDSTWLNGPMVSAQAGIRWWQSAEAGCVGHWHPALPDETKPVGWATLCWFMISSEWSKKSGLTDNTLMRKVTDIYFVSPSPLLCPFCKPWSSVRQMHCFSDLPSGLFTSSFFFLLSR